MKFRFYTQCYCACAYFFALGYVLHCGYSKQYLKWWNSIIVEVSDLTWGNLVKQNFLSINGSILQHIFLHLLFILIKLHQNIFSIQIIQICIILLYYEAVELKTGRPTLTQFAVFATFGVCWTKWEKNMEKEWSYQKLNDIFGLTTLKYT